ncbi:hypothetical protein LIA77_07438 [Sarocladium implicatum]|nr:hypothetical protein LIA77_07438 [Sarocladium implicatum]
MAAGVARSAPIADSLWARATASTVEIASGHWYDRRPRRVSLHRFDTAHRRAEDHFVADANIENTENWAEEKRHREKRENR